MITSFVTKNSGSAWGIGFRILVFRTLGCACPNIGRRRKEPLPMPPEKKTCALASRCASVTVPELEQSKAAVLSTLASAHSRRSCKHAIEKFIDWYWLVKPRVGNRNSQGYGSQTAWAEDWKLAHWPPGARLGECDFSTHPSREKRCSNDRTFTRMWFATLRNRELKIGSAAIAAEPLGDRRYAWEGRKAANGSGTDLV